MPRRHGEPFLKPKQKAELGVKFAELSKTHEGEDPDINFIDYRTSVDIHALHDADMMGTVIPRIVDSVRLSNHLPAKILDLGCGQGLFTDEIRLTFGDDVEVYSTSAMRRLHEQRRRMLFERDKVGLHEQMISMEPDALAWVRSNLSSQMHPNDAKWNSILEMSNSPEFDLIIDTFGEMMYLDTKEETKEYDAREQAQLFVERLEIAVAKLRSHGELHIAHTDRGVLSYLDEHKRELELEFGIFMSLPLAEDRARDLSWCRIYKKPELHPKGYKPTYTLDGHKLSARSKEEATSEPNGPKSYTYLGESPPGIIGSPSEDQSYTYLGEGNNE